MLLLSLPTNPVGCGLYSYAHTLYSYTSAVCCFLIQWNMGSDSALCDLRFASVFGRAAWPYVGGSDMSSAARA